MKKKYFSPEIKVATYTIGDNILESSWIGPGHGELEAKTSYGFWDPEDEDEYDD